LLFTKDNDGRTAWILAALMCKLVVLQKLWEWGREKLRAVELSDKLLLAKDSEERTAVGYASLWGNLEPLQKLWE
jgi:hypothetical protein